METPLTVLKKAMLAVLKEMVVAHWKQERRKVINNFKNGLALCEGVNIHGTRCAFCIVYGANDCAGCPIEVKTGLTDCDDTPYYNVIAWLRVAYYYEHSTRASYEQGIELFNKQIEFLESL